MTLRRRDGLLWAGAAFAAPWACADAPPLRLAAAWARGRQQQVGVLRVANGRASVEAVLDVPTRAHGLLAESAGSVLVTARRPGDWLMRWHPQRGLLAQQWAEPQRCFNGHVLLSRDGHRLYSAETDLDDGSALIGVRDAASLEKLAEWPAAGVDAHQLLLDDDGHLMVAHGGQPMQQETGRMKRAQAHVDSSLVRLDGRSGALLGQWRLADDRLGIRHLAWGNAAAGERLLGIALQAEHDDAALRAAAPVLALFDGAALRSCPLPEGASLAGYGGDIACAPAGWAVSCPRADAIASWHADGRFAGLRRAPGACALAADGAALWSAGEHLAEWRGQIETDIATDAQTRALRLDNHWVRLPATA